jgi:hypothetical protein
MLAGCLILLELATMTTLLISSLTALAGALILRVTARRRADHALLLQRLGI